MNSVTSSTVSAHSFYYSHSQVFLGSLSLVCVKFQYLSTVLLQSLWQQLLGLLNPTYPCAYSAFFHIYALLSSLADLFLLSLSPLFYAMTSMKTLVHQCKELMATAMQPVAMKRISYVWGAKSQQHVNVTRTLGESIPWWELRADRLPVLTVRHALTPSPGWARSDSFLRSLLCISPKRTFINSPLSV